MNEIFFKGYSSLTQIEKNLICFSTICFLSLDRCLTDGLAGSMQIFPNEQLHIDSLNDELMQADSCFPCKFIIRLLCLVPFCNACLVRTCLNSSLIHNDLLIVRKWGIRLNLSTSLACVISATMYFYVAHVYIGKYVQVCIWALGLKPRCVENAVLLFDDMWMSFLRTLTFGEHSRAINISEGYT